MSQTKPVKTAEDYERLGRAIEEVYLSSHSDRKEAYKVSFFKGLASGFGGVLGATILIAFLLWLLSLFDQIPFIGPFVDRVKETVESTN